MKRARSIDSLPGFLVALIFLAGCSGERLEPVEGKVLVEGEPLAHGSFLLKPDAAKGNNSKLDHEPAGLVESAGVYRIYTNKRPGAPAGWYKVVVIGQEPIDPNNPYAPRKAFINAKYNSEQTTDVRIEVTPNAPAGAYDLNLKK